MNEKISQWVLTDTERNIWVETLELGPAELGLGAPARISKRVLPPKPQNPYLNTVKLK